MTTPRPGIASKSSQTGRPIMAVLDLLGKKWALRVLWELYHEAPCTFRTLQKLCGDISPTVLNSRLRELRESGIIENRENEGYVITDEGKALGAIILQLNDWSKRWAERTSQERKIRR